MRKSVLLIEKRNLELLYRLIDGDGRLQVVGSARTDEEALRILAVARPNVVCLDGESRTLGLARRIMAEYPTPIVLVTDDAENTPLVEAAWKAGVLQVVGKPHKMGDPLARQLCDLLVLMSDVPVIRRRSAPPLAEKRLLETNVRAAFRFDLLAVAAHSRAAALAHFLGGLPGGLSVPVLAQSTTGDAPGLASWLGKGCRLPIRVAEDGQFPLPGYVYLAPQQHHLVYREGRLGLELCQSFELDCPSAGKLFGSLAGPTARNSLGVLLASPASEEGLQGLLALRQAGGYTLSEGALESAGAACERKPLAELPMRVLELLKLRG